MCLCFVILNYFSFLFDCAGNSRKKNLPFLFGNLKNIRLQFPTHLNYKLKTDLSSLKCISHWVTGFFSGGGWYTSGRKHLATLWESVWQKKTLYLPKSYSLQRNLHGNKNLQQGFTNSRSTLLSRAREFIDYRYWNVIFRYRTSGECFSCFSRFWLAHVEVYGIHRYRRGSKRGNTNQRLLLCLKYCSL